LLNPSDLQMVPEIKLHSRFDRVGGTMQYDAVPRYREFVEIENGNSIFPLSVDELNGLTLQTAMFLCSFSMSPAATLRDLKCNARTHRIVE
jgi:hypothetical protein